MGRGRIVTPLVAVAVAFLSTAALAFNVSTIAFDDGYVPLFGDGNVVPYADGKTVRLVLNQYSGSGFISSDMYDHGFFSATIKLPSDYTAGVVVAFYTSNGDVFEKTHDELDFEFLGNIRGKPWRVQTNVYGNGSTSRGREERYLMPFDPTKEFHRYSILWTAENIIFYIDDTPIREVRRDEAMGGDYPSKPMALYATIWDASTWATSGGKYRVNYKYGPFVSDFSDLVLLGCRSDPIQQKVSGCDAAATAADLAEYAIMTPERRQAMREFRENYMTYSVCHDSLRYPESLPECQVLESERRRFKETGHLKFGGSHRRHAKRRSRVAAATNPGSQADM